MNLVIVVVKLIFPLLKEYGLSSLRLQSSDTTSVAKTIAMLAVLWHCLLVFFLAEQANNNLEIHKPLITQYQEVSVHAAELENQLKDTQVKLFQCQINATTNIDPPSITAEFHYDPDKKIMVNGK